MLNNRISLTLLFFAIFSLNLGAASQKSVPATHELKKCQAYAKHQVSQNLFADFHMRPQVQGGQLFLRNLALAGEELRLDFETYLYRKNPTGRGYGVRRDPATGQLRASVWREAIIGKSAVQTGTEGRSTSSVAFRMAEILSDNDYRAWRRGDTVRVTVNVVRDIPFNDCYFKGPVLKQACYFTNQVHLALRGSHVQFFSETRGVRPDSLEAYPRSK